MVSFASMTQRQKLIDKARNNPAGIRFRERGARMKYAIVIAYSDEDRGYIATVPELPGCSAFGDTEEEAIREVKVAASLWLTAARKAGRKVPAPIIGKTFKGRFPLRIPEDLRRKLELEAKRRGVSLNELILQKIA